MTGFKCTGCGSCCKRVNIVVKATSHIPELTFPYQWDESGRCEKLGNDNQCTVYEIRPLICNVELLAEFLAIDKDLFYNENYNACIILQEEDKVDEIFKIKL